MTLMHLKRTATFAVVGAALAAWLAAAATSGTRPAAEQPIRRVAADPDTTSLANQVSRLHDRLAPATTPLEPGRDLFRFATPKPKALTVATSHPALTEAAAAGPVAPPRPALKLAGIAEDAQPAGGVVRTAIVSTNGQLFLAREGDAVTPRFKVVRIGADVVELVDLQDNSTVRLALR